MSRPTHTVVADFKGNFKVVPISVLPYSTKGTSLNKAKKLKETYNA